MSKDKPDDETLLKLEIGADELHSVDKLMLKLIREILQRQLTHVQMAYSADCNTERQVKRIKTQIFLCEHAIERSSIIFGSKKYD